MKILAVSDLHGDFNILESHIGKYDLLIIAGDFTNENYKVTKEWLDKLEPYKYIFGNHDDLGQIAFERLLPDYEVVSFRGINLLGINGNFAKKKRFPYHKTPGDVTFGMKHVVKKVDIIVSHEPPLEFADKIRNMSVGQPVLTEVLMKFKPRFWICGHIHSAEERNRGCVYNVNRYPTYLEI